MINLSRKLAFAAIVACSAFSTGLSAQDAAPRTIEAPNPEKLAIARQIIDLSFPVETREPMFLATMDQMVAQTREATLRAYNLQEEEALAILDEWIAKYVDDSKVLMRAHIPSLMEAMAASYATMFTQQELADIRAFASTRSGQRFFQLSPALLAEPNFAAANQAYMNEVQAQLPGAMQDLVGRLERYVSDKANTGSKTKS